MHLKNGARKARGACPLRVAGGRTEAEEEAAAGEALIVVGDLEAGADEGLVHFVRFKEAQLVALDQVLGALGCADKVVEVKVGKAPLDKTGVHSGDLELGLVDELSVDGMGLPGVGREPGFDDQ